MALARQYILDSQYAQVISGMDLRRPQIESLATVHELLRQLRAPIREMDAAAIADKCRQANPQWAFPADYPSLTFALATGVGKSRLVGAIAAYLFRTGESRNFVILAPRDAILRKFEAQSREAADKYIFVDPSVVPQPRVCHRGNLLEFRPEDGAGSFLPTGPNLFIFSPQLLVTGGRIAEPSEFAGASIQEYLRACDDLVVFVDESHHLSSRERDEAVRSWGGALSGLKPKLVFEMTATPREGAAVAYEYDLAQCLRERLYTKAVRLIVDAAGGKLSGEEYDRYTLRFAIGRLKDKEKAVRTIRERMPGFPAIRPVLLVAAENTSHADSVGKWLVEDFGFDEKEVLVIHSNRKTEEDMSALASIEDASSSIRVVVQVHVLDEGWDVTNVYVVATLRNVRSYVNARQVMGRGLRLPAGRRVGDNEVDTLDVLAFGQETFESIFEQAEQEFGSPAEADGGIQVVEAGSQMPMDFPAAKAPDDGKKPQMKVVSLKLVADASVTIPVLDMIPPEPNLDMLVDTRDLLGSDRAAFDLGTLTTTSVGGDLRIDRSRFLEMTTDEVLRDFVYLSDPIHRAYVAGLVERVLKDTGEVSKTIGIDPVLCAKVIVESLVARYRETPPAYAPTGILDRVVVAPAEANVPLQYSKPFEKERLWVAGWSKQTHFRMPVAGWQNCSHDTAHFDSKPEFEMAYRLDRMQGVRLWLRNEPGQVVVPTLAGNTKPDFVVWLSDGRVLLLEVKGEYLWEPNHSDSWVRARDLRTWLQAANGAGGDQFEFVLLLGASVDHAVSLQDVFALDEVE